MDVKSARDRMSGNLYVHLRGGFLLAGSKDQKVEVEKMVCSIEFGDKAQEVSFWGRYLKKEEVRAHVEKIVKFEDAPNRWYFGTLASNCPRGAACPDPENCEMCTPTKGIEEDTAGDAKCTCEGDAEEAAVICGKCVSKTELATRSPRFSKADKLMRRFREFTSADRQSRSKTEEDERENPTFQSKELLFHVKDYFGRVPLSFNLSAPPKKKICIEDDGTVSPMTRKNHGQLANGNAKRSWQEIGSGKAYLSDALSFESTKSMFLDTEGLDQNESNKSVAMEVNASELESLGRRDGGDSIQVIRIMGKSGSKATRVCGCLVVELCYIPKKIKSSTPPNLHDSVIRGQPCLSKAVLNACQKDLQIKALTKRIRSAGNMNPIELAVHCGQKGVLQELLDCSNSQVWAESSSQHCFKGRNVLHLSVIQNNPKALQLIYTYAYRHDLFHLSFFDGVLDLHSIRNALSGQTQTMLLSQRDDDGRTPFLLSCTLPSEVDAMPLVLSLLEFDQEVSETDNNGDSGLMLAVKSGQVSVALTLLNLQDDGPPGIFLSRAKPNLPNKLGLRPLHIACEQGNVELVKALLEAGAYPSLQSLNGSTPLHLAAINGHAEVVKTLLGWSQQYKARQVKQQENEQKIGDEPEHIAVLAQAIDEVVGNDCAYPEPLANDPLAIVASSNESTDANSSCSAHSKSRPVQKFKRLFNFLYRKIRRRRSEWQNVTQDPREIATDVESDESAPNGEGDVETTPSSENGPENLTSSEVEVTTNGTDENSSLAEVAAVKMEAEKETFKQERALAESISNRKPRLWAIQWSSGKTACQLAKFHGHEEVYMLLAKAQTADSDGRERKDSKQEQEHGCSLQDMAKAATVEIDCKAIEEEEEEDDWSTYEYNYEQNSESDSD